MKALPQWVCAWNSSKVPMRATEYRAASSTDTESWSTYEQAAAAVAQGVYDNIGFVFADNGYVGIDIDRGHDDEGFLSELSVDILNRCQSYTEKSRSGRGFHIILKGNLPFKGRNNNSGLEIYRASRYFIMTGKVLLFDSIVENQAAIDYIVEQYFPETIRESGGFRAQKIYTPTYPRPEAGKVILQPNFPEIPQGMRNNSLASLAGQMHTQGYSKAEIFRQLSRCNEAACKPKLPEREIQMICESITRYER